MKKWIVGLAVVGLLVGAYFWVSRNAKIEWDLLIGKTAQVERKNLSIPIRASGLIEPAAPPVEIKSKASGEVATIQVKAGDLVQMNQLLLQLDPKDEKRNVDRAKAELDRAAATLAKAKIALQQQKDDYPPNVDRAKAGLTHAEATLGQLKYELDEQERMHESGGVSEKVLSKYRYVFKQGEAQVEQMQAELKRVENTSALIAIAEQDVALAQAAYDVARKNHEDAVERLNETERFAPIDGMVAKINVHVGELILSGTTSFTGGTVLMTIADISDLYVTAQVDEADISAVLDLAPAEARPGMQRVAALLEQQPTAAAAIGDANPHDLVPAATTPPTDSTTSPRADSAGAPQAASAGSRPAESVVLPGGVAKGTPVEITVEAFRDEKFHGVIEHIAPEPLRQQSVVTYDVRIRLTSPNRYKLLLGMQAESEFTSQTFNALVVPIDAVRTDGDQRGVYVPGKGTGPGAQPRFVPCRFGVDDGSCVEVISGLQAGNVVYTQLPIQIKPPKEESSE